MTQSGAGPGHGAVPVELTHFVGREHELAALRQLAGTARLLTLTGAGGSGKSRLALELVRDLPAAALPVIWVELAPLMEERLVAAAVLRALGSPTEGGAATPEAVAATIGARSLTLVLDNCEHLVAACAALADAALRACPNLRVIATSREALGVAGERAWLVPPLVLPPSGSPLATIAQSDAVRLFVDRARDVLPSFDLTETNAQVVSDICARLDGIPLAIELAAARVRHLSPDQILTRLSDAFALLTTGARTALPRHRTLRATLDWSHDLLRHDGRVVLRRLSVFRGGFTLDMVEQVVAGDGIVPTDVLDLIGILADRSMVVVRELDDSARYGLLETMRQYAAQRLEEAGETQRVQRRLADAVTALVADAEPHFTRRSRREAFARLEPELDNIREVLRWTLEHDPSLHVRLVGMLWWFWFTTRHWVQAHRWITGALELPAAAAPSPERAALLFAAGALAALRAQTDEARPLLEEAVALAGATGNERLEAYALNYLAMTYSASLSPAGREYSSRAERWLRANDDEYGLRLALLLGGMAEFGAGNSDRACAMMEEAVAIARRFGQDRELAVALQTYASVLVGQGDVRRIAQLARESLVALKRDPSFLFIARAIDVLAYSSGTADPVRAARALGTASAMRAHIGANRFQHDEVVIAALIERLRAALGDAAYDAAFSEGTQVKPADAIDEMLGPESMAPVSTAAAAEDSGRPAQAAAADSGGPVLAAVPAPAPAGILPGRERTEPPADLDVRALGPLEVSVLGVPVESWSYAKPRELLMLLLLHPEGTTRAGIGAALWPDAAPAQVRNSFHVTMHHLRRALGHADWVVLADEHYRLAPGLRVNVDVRRFEEQVRAALTAGSSTAIHMLRDAMALYRGHFLAGVAAGPWRDEVQDRLRRLFCDAGMRLGELLEAAGSDDEAAGAYERVVACEPLHEAAHRGLLLTLTRTGRRAHAMRHYDRLAALLEELELEPEPETVELQDRIRNAGIAAQP